MDIDVRDGFALDMLDSTGQRMLDPNTLLLTYLNGFARVLVGTSTEVTIQGEGQTVRVFGQNLDDPGSIQVFSIVWMTGDRINAVYTQLDLQSINLAFLVVSIAFDTISGQSSTWESLLYGEDNLTGADGDDVLIGYERSDRLLGGAGHDVLYGDFKVLPGPSPLPIPIPTFHGNDWLDGGEGADDMFGGKGNDTYVVDNAGDRIAEAKDAGYDTIRSSVNWNLGGLYVEDLILTGAADIFGFGNSLNNTLTGNDGVNVLAGAKGDDTYWVQTVGDRAVEYKDEGFDVVHSSVNFSLAGQFIEDLWLEGDANLTGQGNSLDNYLRGNAGINLLAGGKGNDRYFIQNVGDRVIENSGEGVDEVFSAVSFSLAGQYIENLTLSGDADLNGTGNSVDNYLRGNAGRNVLTGGKGNDSYEIQTAGDKAVEAAGEGTDIVYASVTYSLAGQHIENLTLFGFGDIDATGNSYDNVLTGNIGQNELIGGKGDDTYYVQTVGDIVRENDKQGYDKVFSSVGFSLGGQYIEELILTGAADINADGNSLSNRLTGNAGANVIYGAGALDFMWGGGGADTFVYGSTKDSIAGTSDRIMDLEAIDKIDLSRIDANTALAGNQAFQLVSSLSAATTDGAGRAVLKYDANNSWTLLELDVNGDGRADSRIVLMGDHTGHANWAW